MQEQAAKEAAAAAAKEANMANYDKCPEDLQAAQELAAAAAAVVAKSRKVILEYELGKFFNLWKLYQEKL